MQRLVQFFNCDAPRGQHRGRKLRNELLHLLIALVALSKSSDEYRKCHGDVRSWACARGVIYHPDGTNHYGLMLPLAEKLNKELALGLPLHKYDWEWAYPQNMQPGFINMEAAKLALQDPAAVHETWEFVKKGESLRIPPCHHDCSGDFGTCCCCFRA